MVSTIVPHKGIAGVEKKFYYDTISKRDNKILPTIYNLRKSKNSVKDFDLCDEKSI